MYPGNKRKKLWREEKERLLKMTLEERRKEYLRGYVALKDIPTWMEEMRSKNESDGENAKEDVQGKRSLSEKVSLYRGDITLLEVDAIVNAANSSLLGGGGVDGCIHRAAGPCLLAECRNLSGCETGQAKITCGYDLPAKCAVLVVLEAFGMEGHPCKCPFPMDAAWSQDGVLQCHTNVLVVGDLPLPSCCFPQPPPHAAYVIHTVGPIARGHLTDTHKENLASCYKSSLKLAKENSIKSLAFPCISTGIYGFPNEPAAVIALNTTKEWLSKNHNEVDRIIFCVFLEVDYKIFKKKMGEIFPIDDNEETEISEETGLEQKSQPLSPTKCKAEQAEDVQDDVEGGNSAEEKQSVEETVGPSQEADETKPSAVASLSSSEEAKPSEDKDSLKVSKGTRESDPAHPMGCEQDQAQGQQEDAVEEEMKTGADSQSSCMEIEEPLLNQEDTTEEEKPLIPRAEEKEKEGGGVQEEKGGMQEQEETSAEPMKVELACEATEASSNDAEMDNQVESIKDPMETVPKA
ncbi:ADP-ribose glycohydrolase MACROD2 isoform X2 [Lagopus muta]|uniref:ADP-ribose glycohydrolase MACROD2 isoform X2 n=1 Tax=Lagopus muta TaxID=64668 RepID=UPI00209CCB00|nr:ADP-ribose glycohydrolase MACROD2 isoform X2 [Lagopus muta]